MSKLKLVLFFATIASIAVAQSASAALYDVIGRIENVNVSSTAISGDIAMLGYEYGDYPNGTVSLYRISGSGSPALLSTITDPDPNPEPDPDDHHGDYESPYFGRSSALSGNLALIGAMSKTIGDNSNSGAVHLYDISNPETPQKRSTIYNPTSNSSEYFGSSVSVYGDYALIGANGVNSASEGNVGAAYLYDVSEPDTPKLLRTIANPSTDIKDRDNFGSSVSIFGQYAIIGARGDRSDGYVTLSNGSRYEPGIAYVYDLSAPGDLQPIGTIHNPTIGTSNAQASFGTSISMAGGYALISAFDWDVNGNSYLYDLSDLTAPIKTFGGTKDDFGFPTALGGGVALIADLNNGRGDVLIYDMDGMVPFTHPVDNGGDTNQVPEPSAMALLLGLGTAATRAATRTVSRRKS